MNIVKEFINPADLNQRDVRYHVTTLVSALMPAVFYSAFFIYFSYIDGADQFLSVLGVGVVSFLIGVIFVHYRKLVAGAIWVVCTGICLCCSLTLLAGWKYGFQFGLIPPLLFSGLFFKGQEKVKFIVGVVTVLSFVLLGYFSFDLQDNFRFPEGHGLYILMTNILVPLMGPGMSTIASMVYAEQIEEKLESSSLENEKLLHNILPKEIAKELRETGSVKPARYENVSIMFSDFKGFTNIVASIPTKKLVEELNEIFSQFDDIVESEGVEKIQTVGDGYLAACGLPREVDDHALRCVRAAKRMIDFLNERNEISAIKWKARIGIHSGPISAGVIGKKKFAYDLFGDTLNIASRIESNGEEGRINVSAYTYDLIKDEFPSEYRGKLNAKGKGELDMYFVNAH